MIGKVHSFQSLGTVDGPGIRFVTFLMGCPLRCACCHNPDLWGDGGKEYTAEQVVESALKYRDYFGEKGGITLSGGEPLMQAEFCESVFRLAKENGINTCLDTSGCVLNEKVKKLLDVTDRVLLDIKYLSEELYEKYVGCSFKSVIDFLEYLNCNNIPTTVRQVIIPTLNDSVFDVEKLKELVKKYPCVDKTELLPLKKICQVKYDNMGIEFPLKDFPTPTKEQMEELNKIING
ncbi:MAG: pyruvate formate lyase-activating protein [Clostridiales bacterium]|nr:pyruvate formate lyase-activating protein [Clostridiales bacterium]